MVIGDEAHTFKANSLQKLMNKCTKAWMRVGTTGTVGGEGVNRLLLEACFGPIYKVISTKELMDSDTLSKMSIQILTLKYSEEEKKSLGKLKYQDEVAFLTQCEKRNDFIKDLALAAQGNTLILFNYVKNHGEPLFRLIEKAAGDKRKVFFISGSVKTDDRERIRKILEKEKNAIIVATAALMSTGTNIPTLTNLIFAAPTKSQIRVLQSIGRTLRKSEHPAVIFDIVDDLRYKTRINYTYKHGIERMKVYNAERFDYKTKTIAL